MQRRLRLTLAAAVAVPALALGAGTASAAGLGGLFGSHASASHHGDDSVDCTAKFDKHQRALKENDFPSYNSPRAESNSTRHDARSSDGTPYYTHNATCDDAPRENRFHRNTYKTLNGNTFTNSANRGYKPDRFDYDHYGPNRCQANGNYERNCQRHSGHARSDDDRYGADLKKVNGSDGYSSHSH